jgi:uncharacterized repeat protein (TIGR02543 family)
MKIHLLFLSLGLFVNLLFSNIGIAQITINPDEAKVRDANFETQLSKTKTSFFPTKDSKDTWIQWDDGVNYSHFGLTSADVFSVASRWETSDISTYSSYCVTRLAVYIHNVPTASVAKIWQGVNALSLVEVHSQAFSTSEDSWVELELDIPYIIDLTQELWFGFQIDDPGAGISAPGLDEETDFDGKGNMIKFGLYGNWETLLAYGVQGDWNIHAYIEPIATPSLTTTAIYDITNASAKSGGTVTDQGYAPVTERGVVWSTSEYPTIESNDGITSDGDGIGEFLSTLTGLSHNTDYFIRAYATNLGGTEYGDQLSFTTTNNLPEIEVDPTSFEEYVQVGEMITRSLTIYNNGDPGSELYISLDHDYISKLKEQGISFEFNNNALSSSKPRVNLNNNLTRSFDLTKTEFAPHSATTASQKDFSKSFTIEDVQFNFPVGDANGEYGVGSDGSYIYTNRWNDIYFYRYSLDGEFLGSFTIEGISNLRDLTYDGQYFYGSPNNNIIYIMDFSSQTLIGTITTSIPNIRAIAYDPDNDGFWVSNNWNGPLTLINRSGASIDAISVTVGNIGGMAWENASEDGPFLWIYSQYDQNTIYQIDMTTGNAISSFNVGALGILSGSSGAGGLFFTDAIIPNEYTLLGMCQNDVIWGLYMGNYANWLSISEYSGIINSGESLIVEITFDATDLVEGIYEAAIAITTNDPINPNIDVPVTLHVNGTPDISVSDESLDFGTVKLAQVYTLPLEITNSGNGLLEITNIQFSETQFYASVTELTFNPNKSKELLVSFYSEDPGLFEADLTFTTNVTGQELFTIPLTAEILLYELTLLSDPVDGGILTGDGIYEAGDGVILTATPNIGYMFLSWTDENEELVSSKADFTYTMPEEDVTLTANFTDQIPSIAVSPTSMEEDLEAGQTSTQNITITNEGQGVLIWSLSSQFVGSKKTRKLGNYADESRTRNNSLPQDALEKFYLSSKDLGDVLGVYYNSSTANTGMVWANGFLYMLNYEYSQLLKYDIATESVVETSNVTGSPFGITWDGEYLWIGNPVGNVYAYNLDGTSAGYSFSVSLNDFAALTWDGEYFVVNYAFGYNPTFYRMDETGTPIEAFTSSDNQYSCQIVYVPQHTMGHIWSINAETQKINQYQLQDGAASLVQQFDVPQPGYETYSIAHNGVDLWWSYWGGPLYQIDDGIIEINWLSFDIESGSIPSGESQMVEITFDATNLNSGIYEDVINVNTNDPVDPKVNIPVTLSVNGTPDIELPEEYLDFGYVNLSQEVTLPFTINNPGTEVLEITSIQTSETQFYTSITEISVNPKKTYQLMVSFYSEDPGLFEAELTFTTNVTGQESFTIPLTAEILVYELILLSDPVDGGILTGDGIYEEDDEINITATPNVGYMFLNWTDENEEEVSSSANFTYTMPAESITLTANFTDQLPEISVDPTSFEEDLYTGETVTRTLTITNSGDYSLNLNIELIDLEKSEGKTNVKHKQKIVQPEAIVKGVEIPNIYLNSPKLDGGGPDDFGYSWTTKDISWIDASGGTTISLSDDSYASNIPLGFDFSYYDETYSLLNVMSNGWVSFTNAQTWYPSYIPGYGGGIVPFGRDLNPASGGYIRYLTGGSAPYRYFVVEYNNIRNYGSELAQTFEVVFYETTNRIVFQYLVVASTPSSIGIENANGTIGMGNGGSDDLFINPNIVTSNSAIEFAVPIPNWLFLSSFAETIPAGEQFDVDVTFDATELTGGTYEKIIRITSNDPENPVVDVPVTLNVTGRPLIEVSNESLDFGYVKLNTVATLPITIINPGSETLELTSIQTSEAQFDISHTEISVTPFGSQQLLVSFYSEDPGLFEANLTFTTNVTEQESLTIPLMAEILIYELTLLVEPVDGGTVTGEGQYEQDDEVTITATPNEGYIFINWTFDGEDVTSESIFTFDMPPQDITLVANFTNNIPEILIEPNSFVEELNTGDITMHSLTISNTGDEESELYFSLDIDFVSKGKANSKIEKIDAKSFTVDDLQFSFPVALGTGEYSVGCDGNYIYTSQWVSGQFVTYTLAGDYIETFTIDGVTGIRDLAYDGQYFYGSPNSNTIYIMDFTGETLIGTITTSITNIRAITYDAYEDGFWVSNGWNDPLTLVDRSGATVRSIDTPVDQFAGLAWDKASDGGPFLWGYTNDGSNNVLYKIDLESGDPIFSFNVETLGILSGSSSAGGLMVSNQLVPGEYTLLGISENDAVWGLSLGPITDGWLWPSIVSGMITSGESQDIELTFDATGLYGGIYESIIRISSNDPNNLEVEIPVILNITGIPILDISHEMLNFGEVQINTPKQVELIISNVGSKVLEVSNIQCSLPNFEFSNTDLSIDPFGNQPLFITFTSDILGLFEATLTFTTNDADNPSVSIDMMAEAKLPPAITVDPTSFYEYLGFEHTVERVMTITNEGELPLEFSITSTFSTESSGKERFAGDVDLGERSVVMANVPNTPTVTINDFISNIPGSKGRSDANILLYEDVSDFYWYNAALDELGYGYTSVGSWAALETALTGGTQWDLVLVNSYNYNVSSGPLDALVNHLESGGNLIFAHWGGTDFSGHDLSATLGINFVSSFTTPINFNLTPEASILNAPNTLPDAFNWTHNQWNTDGQIVEPLSGATVLAVFSGYPSSGAIVLNEGGNAIFNAFQADNYSGDSNTSGNADIQELIENQIEFLLISNLILSHTSGTVLPGESFEVIVTLSSVELDEGVYEGEIAISSNDPENPEVLVPVTIEVDYTIPVPSTVTLLVSPDDIDAVLTGAGDYIEGEEVSITSSIVEGYAFIGWTGETEDVALLEDALALVTTFTMPDRDVILTASYQPIDYMVEVIIQPEDAGSVTGDGIYNINDEVTLEATPIVGYEFFNWRVDGLMVSEDNPYTFTMPASDMLIAAHFKEEGADVFTLTLLSDPDDLGALLSGAGDYLEDDQVFITTTLIEGYLFVGWTGEVEDVALLDDATALTTSFDMPGRDVTLTAAYEFIVPTHALTLLADPDNIGAVLTGDGDYEEEEEVNISASIVEGYTFAGWTGEAEDVALLDDATALETFFTMPDRDVTLTGSYQLTDYTVTVIIQPEGTGTVTGEGTYNIGDEVTLEATPSAGYEFLNWRLDGFVVSDENPYTFTMLAEDIVIAAHFKEEGADTYTLTLLADPDDIGAIVIGAGEYLEGDEVLIATSNVDGYDFTGWTGEAEDIALLDDAAAQSTFFTMPDRNITLTASYQMQAPTYNVILLADPDDIGAVLMGAGEYYEDDEVNIFASIVEGYTFAGWVGEAEDVALLDDATALETFFTMPDRDVTLTASYQLTDYTVTVIIQPEGTGTVTGEGTYNMGDEVTLEATPSEGYEFFNWRIDGFIVSNDNPYTFTMPEEDIVIAAHFKEEGADTYMLILLVDPDDIGAIVIGAGEYLEGDEVLIATNEIEGYDFIGWTGEAEDIALLDDATAMETSFVMPTREVTLTANYEEMVIPTYTVTFTVRNSSYIGIAGASISIAGEVTLTTNANGNATTSLENGTYSYTVTATGYYNHNGSFTVADANQQVNVTMIAVSVETEVLSSLEVFPNPFSSSITLNNASGVSRLIVTNIIGQRVMDMQLSGSERITIPTDGLTRGIYLMVFEAENGERVVKKMVKE